MPTERCDIRMHPFPSGSLSSRVVQEWKNEKTSKTCYFCKMAFKAGKQHNCRLCGELVCSACTGKYHLPEKYDLKVFTPSVFLFVQPLQKLLLLEPAPR